MKESGVSRASAHLASPFTLAGKWRSIVLRRPGISALSLAPFLFLAPAGPASARPETGRTSSASISISVSVAPRFGLGTKPASIQSVDEGASSGSGYCIATNDKQPALPVRLVRTKAAENGYQLVGRGEPLPGCNGGSNQPAGSRPSNAGSAELLIISPE